MSNHLCTAATCLFHPPVPPAGSHKPRAMHSSSSTRSHTCTWVHWGNWAPETLHWALSRIHRDTPSSHPCIHCIKHKATLHWATEQTASVWYLHSYMDIWQTIYDRPYMIAQTTDHTWQPRQQTIYDSTYNRLYMTAQTTDYMTDQLTNQMTAQTTEQKQTIWEPRWQTIWQIM